MAMRVSTSQSRDDPSHHAWLNLAAPGHMTSLRLVASYGVEIQRLQRPSIRAGSHPPSPDSVCVCRREPEGPEAQPHLYDGVLRRPRISAGRRHQYPD